MGFWTEVEQEGINGQLVQEGVEQVWFKITINLIKVKPAKIGFWNHVAQESIKSKLAQIGLANISYKKLSKALRAR